MREVIIHAGMTKTGSSSIQQTLHCGELLPVAVYPDLGEANHSKPLLRAFATETDTGDARRQALLSIDDIESRRQDTRDAIRKTAEGSPDATLILSAEGVIGLRTGGLLALRRFLDDLGYSIRVFAYLRPPGEHLSSRFQQRLKMRMTPFDPQANMRPHDRYIQCLDEAFGQERVEQAKYDRRRFPDGCVVKDFLRRFGLDHLPLTIHRDNERLSLPAVRLLFAYRKLAAESGETVTLGKRNQQMLRRLGELDGPPFRYAPYVIRRVLEANRSQIDWVSKRLGESFEDGPTDDCAEAIDCEDDLLRFDDHAIDWLCATTQRPTPPTEPAARSRAVAAMMRVLNQGDDRPSMDGVHQPVTEYRNARPGGQHEHA